MTNYTEQFDTAIQTVTKERGEVYGHPEDDFAMVSDIKEVLRRCDDPIIRHVLEMIAVKMCRLTETPNHLDSWIDIAGYARTACMVLDRRMDRGELK